MDTVGDEFDNEHSGERSLDQRSDYHNSNVAGTPIAESRTLPLQSIGRYEILSLLGTRGPTTTFLVRDPVIYCTRALTIPHIAGRATAEVQARFLFEAQVAARLNHRNICKIVDFGYIDGSPYYTMQHIEGVTLSEKCAKSGFPSIADAVAIVRAVADAMTEAHSKGIIHRDLKPRNIILDEFEEPIIVGFSLAIEFAGIEDRDLPKAGTTVDTIAYMSPEQIFEPGTVGPACDIWSLGVILYELLTGRRPFVGSQIEILQQIHRDKPRRLSKVRPDIPRELEATCLKMIQKRPSDRYSSMADVVAAFDEFLNL